MRIGISLAEPRSGSLDELTSALQQAADDGLSSAWMADIFGLDALSALAYAGSRVADIEVGTAVTPTYLRHPVALARQAITTDVATGGRLALGIGLSHQVVIEGMLHLSFDKPARHMREYLAVLLPLLREGRVSFSGRPSVPTRRSAPGRSERCPSCSPPWRRACCTSPAQWPTGRCCG